MNPDNSQAVDLITATFFFIGRSPQASQGTRASRVMTFALRLVHDPLVEDMTSVPSSRDSKRTVTRSFVPVLGSSSHEYTSLRGRSTISNFSEDEEDATILEGVRDAVATPYAQINLRAHASHPARPPPRPQLLRRRPRLEEALRARADHASRDERERGRRSLEARRHRGPRRCERRRGAGSFST